MAERCFMVLRPQLLGFERDLGVAVRVVAGWSGALAVKEEKRQRRRKKRVKWPREKKNE
jgi:hypothetical protein